MKFNFWKIAKEQKLPRCVMLGADCSGKTTLLYMWHMGQVVSTIPTIGFNLETIHHSGRTIDALDFGGCGNIAPLARHYLDSTTGVLFLHALNSNSEQLRESIELLRLHAGQLVDTDGRYIWVMATKQDLVPAEELDARRTEFYNLAKSVLDSYGSAITWKIFDDRGLSATDLTKVWPVFDDIAKVLSDQSTVAKTIVGKVPYNEEQMREKIRQEGVEDDVPEKFWSDFLNAELPRWSHRSHLRAGYVMLLKSASMLEDFWAAVDTFLNHIERLRRSRPNHFRNTAHRTMTTFWLHMLRLAILDFRSAQGRLPREDEFQTVLLWYPRLADTSFWEEFYSRTTIFTPQAKYNWCLPDKKSLPLNLQRRYYEDENDKISTWQYYNSDTNTVRTSEKKSGAQMRFIRFAVSLVQYYLRSGERRGKVVVSGLAQLQRSIVQLRAANMYTPTTVPPYSETQAYFWIQIVHATLAPFYQQHKLKSTSNLDASTGANDEAAHLILSLTYAQFIHIFPIDPTLWRQYYTDELWNSIKARMTFVNPDKRSLPNVLPKPSSTLLAERFLEATNPANLAGRLTVLNTEVEDRDAESQLERTPEEVSLRIDAIIATVEHQSQETETADIDKEAVALEVLQNSVKSTTADPLASLLHKLYISLKHSTNGITGVVNVPQFMALVLASDADQLISSEKDANLSVENHVDVNLRSSLGNMGISDEEKADNTKIGMTKLLFYARMTLALGRRSEKKLDELYGRATSHENEEKTGLLLNTFKDFLIARPALLWEDFPFNFYRPETWNSLDAKVMMISPDLKLLP